MTRTRSLRLAALAGAAIVFGGDLSIDTMLDGSVVSKTASAQGRGGNRGGGGMRGMGGMRDIQELLLPDYSRRDMPLFAEQLQLDDGQKAIVESLIEDYEDAFGTGSEAVQGDLMDLGRSMMQSFMGGGAMGDMRERMRERFGAVRAELDEMEANGQPLSEEERRAFFRERMEGMQQEMMQDAMDSGAFDEARGVMTEMLDILEDWVGTRKGLHDSFVSDVQIQLNDDQLVLWPAFERFLVREKSLPRGRLSGEEANLFAVVDEVELSDAAYDALEPLFDQYELDLHNALVARDDYLLTSAPKLFKAMRDGDVDDAERILKRQVALREAIRDVNDRHRQLFTAAIADEAERAALDMAILEAAYERVYRPTWGQRAFEAALGLDGLSDDTLQSIVDLQASFLSEIVGLNRMLIGELRKSEADRQVDEGTRMVAVMSGDLSRGMPFGPGGRGPRGGEDDPFREGMDKRNAVDERYVEQLKALLTPEQQEALPQQRGGRGGGPGGQGGPGGGNADRRAEMIQRFDTNGDGELNEEERRAMFESFRNGGGRGNRGGGEQGEG